MSARRLLRSPLLAALLLTTAAASPYPPLAFVQPLQAPPVQAAPPGGASFTPAPVPNQDLDNPALRTSSPARAELSPGIYQPGTTLFQGDGFTPNSTVQGEQQRHYHPAPSLNFSVPLQ
jgi:hypothetical protein